MNEYGCILKLQESRKHKMPTKWHAGMLGLADTPGYNLTRMKPGPRDRPLHSATDVTFITSRKNTMGAGDHHRRDDKDRPILDQHSGDAEAAVADVGVMEEPLVPVDDVWAAAEGYTPLRDMQGEGLFSDGGSTTFYTTFAGSFLTQLADQAEEEEDESSVVNEAQVATEKLVDKEDETDFRRLADQALMALDNEYQRTQVAHLNQSDSESFHLNTAGGQTLTHSNEAVTEDSASDSCLDDGMSDITSTAAFASYQKAIPNVDSEAVRRAVQNIELSNPKLKQGLEQWEQDRKQAARAVAPRLHSIIPSAPLAAFRKQTPKAVESSSNLSRSATITEALRRFNVLQSEGNVEKTLRIHIVGCDHVECESLERLRVLFGPVVRWIGVHADSPAHIYLDLIGPNMPQQAAAWSPLNLLPSNINALKQCLQSATLSCHVGLYHDWLSACSNLPDLVVAFNAGVWGYGEWETTLSSVVHRNLSIPFVFTAYTIQEAEDDEDVIRKVLPPDANNRCEWEPESNPFASNKARETHSAPTGRSYRENAAWQGWRL
jgi:hypothetical protein